MEKSTLSIIYYSIAALITVTLSIFPIFWRVEYKEWEKNLWKKLGKNGRIILVLGAACVLFGILGYWQDKIADTAKESQAQREHINEFERLRKELNEENMDLAEKVTQGITITFLLDIPDIKEKRKKYIFDYGKSLTENRASLYLESDNTLVFRVFDKLGIVYSLPLKTNFITFKKNARYFITCRIGVKNNYSFISLMLDDREVAKQEFGTMIDMSMIEWSGLNGNPNMHVGSDITGSNTGNFKLTGLAVFDLLTKKQVYQFMQIFITFREAIEISDSTQNSINLPKELFTIGKDSTVKF